MKGLTQHNLLSRFALILSDFLSNQASKGAARLFHIAFHILNTTGAGKKIVTTKGIILYGDFVTYC